MKRFVIMDTTSNTGAEYIDCNGENCVLEENAEQFESSQEASDAITRRGWDAWATVYEI